MLFPDILCERLVPDYDMVLEIVCVSCYVSMRFMQPIVSCSCVARKRRRRPASAAELAPHIFVAARSSSDELSYGGRLVSCLVSSCLIVASSHSCRPTPTLLSASTLAPSPTTTLTFPRTTPTTRPLPAGASHFSPTFGYSYRQRSSHTQYKPYSRSLASPPLHMA
jgi:hypothetical protein